MVLTREAMPTTPSEARMLFREGSWTQDTLGICNGYTNANLVIVPKDLAYDFLLFCQRNPKPCPVLEVLDEGDPTVRVLADGADIRSDLPGTASSSGESWWTSPRTSASTGAATW